MSLILQWFRKGSLGAAHNLLEIYLRIESGELDSRKDPHLDYGEAMTSQGQTADRSDSRGHRIES